MQAIRHSSSENDPIKIAKETVSYVESVIIKIPNRPNIQFNRENQKIIEEAKKELDNKRVESTFLTARYHMVEPNRSIASFDATVDYMTDNKIGKCGECCYVGLFFLYKQGYNLDKVEIISVENPGQNSYRQHHCFLVFNREKDSDINDSRTWGSRAVVCDVWELKNNQVYYGKEHHRKFPGERLTKPNHYVTGIGKNYSGLMVEELSSPLSEEDRAKLLLTIDKEYLVNKLKLSPQLTYEEALEFVKHTLVVPVYLGGGNEVEKLYPALYLFLHSPLAHEYKKIIFHVNARSYSEEHFNASKKQLSLKDDMPSFELVSHFFPKREDYHKIYQLSSGKGVAFISSDKVLELTISFGLLPLYVPLPWKNKMAEKLIEYVDSYSSHGCLLQFLREDKSEMMKELKSCSKYSWDNLGTIFGILNSDTVKDWLKNKRQFLIETSFYKVLEREIIPEIIKAAEKQIFNEDSSLYTLSSKADHPGLFNNSNINSPPPLPPFNPNWRNEKKKKVNILK